ncbi:MAG: ArsR/SmtB family transcription factor [Pyrinomonadaceae bacterium]
MKKQFAECAEEFIHKDKVLRAEKRLLNGLDSTELARTFQALADPTRLRIISALVRTELCVCDIAALLGISQSAISHQLRLMRNQRIVKSRKEGRIVYYTLDDKHISDLYKRGLEHLKHG